MRTSRSLVNWSAHCVGVGLVPDSNADLRQKFLIEGSQPAVVVATKEGQEIGRVAAPERQALGSRRREDGRRRAQDPRDQPRHRAQERARRWRRAATPTAAAELYRQVAGDGCLFPSLAKKAIKALDRMGKSADVAAVGVPAPDAPTPDLSAADESHG